MSDYISRDEIFSVWRSMPKPASISSLTEAINRTPAADVEPVRRWIPCSESLPEKNGAYLVANDIGFIGVRSFAVEKRFDSRRETLENVWWYLDDEWEDQIATGITHWQPLPEPPEPRGGCR